MMFKVFSALVLFAYCQCILAQTSIIGKSCYQTSDCASSSSSDVICKDNVCTCSDNTVPTYDRRQCISKVSHNGVCEEGIQCSYSNEAECSNSRCQCREGYSYNGVTCVGETSGLGNSCQVNAQCTVEGDLAQKTVWCGNDKTCSCRNGYKQENGRCVIGGLCSTNEQCTANNGLENSWCDIRPRDDRRFSCACNSSFIPAVNNTRCLPIVHELGNGCEDSAQCSAKLGDAYCSARYQCRCVEGAQIKDNFCSGAVISMMFSISCLVLVVIVKLF